jgi:threonine dehydrogenase-like Zn-dependent dehydrogenase
MGTMRIAHLLKQHQFVVEKAQIPEPGDHEVLIKVVACGVCKGDFDAWNGKNGDYPLEPGSPGHEAYGKIEKKGSGVTSVEIGDVVTAITFPGYGYAEYVTAKEQEIVKIPAALKDQVILGEPLACALNGARKTQVRVGDSVLVIGVGFMGALMISMMKNSGAAPLIAADISDYNRDLARRLGADIVIDPSHEDYMAIVKSCTEGRGADVVIEATGLQPALEIATAAVRIKGTISIYGYHTGGKRTIDLERWNWKALTVVNAHERDTAVYADGMRRAISLLQYGKMKFDLITQEFTLDGINQGFETILQRPRGYIKAIIRP